jgi:hypothetical protein
MVDGDYSKLDSYQSSLNKELSSIKVHCMLIKSVMDVFRQRLWEVKFFKLTNTGEVVIYTKSRCRQEYKSIKLNRTNSRIKLLLSVHSMELSVTQ